jgi:hypothetical protein
MTNTMTSQDIDLSSWDTMYCIYPFSAKHISLSLWVCSQSANIFTCKRQVRAQKPKIHIYFYL